MKRWIRGAGVPVATVLVTMASALPAWAWTAVDEVQGWEEVLQYTLCALAVAAAASGFGLAAAIAGCIFNELFN